MTPSAWLSERFTAGSSSLRIAALHLAGRLALRQFERSLDCANIENQQVLRRLLAANAGTVFGRRHGFADLDAAPDLLRAFRARVPLSTYPDYALYVERIAEGESGVLTAEPVSLLARSAGTTDFPKQIPRTRSAQRHHLRLVVLAEQAVIDRGIPGATARHRGVNLMSLHVPPAGGRAVTLMSGPNAGMARIRRHIAHLWTSPEPVFEVEHQTTALYLHALFALRERRALYVETPFSPKLVGWFNIIERFHRELIADLRNGTLADHLKLSSTERDRLGPWLRPDPARAREVAAVCAGGFAGIVARLWPEMRYLRTVTTGSFALSRARLAWFAGPTMPIHSGCHSSSEGIIGINLRADGSSRYTLAIGAAFFEFIPSDALNDVDPPTVDLCDLQVGQDYEVVLTSTAGLYRYRLGDIVRINAFRGQAPEFEFLYRRGTILNLVGEKTTEYHTAQALSRAVAGELGSTIALVDYSVLGEMDRGVGRYKFFVELAEPAAARCRGAVESALDRTLGEVNEFYLHNGRVPERLAPPTLVFVRPGAFAALEEQRLRRLSGVSAMQIKTPRVLAADADIGLLNSYRQLVTSN